MATLEGMGDLSLQGGTNQVERNLYEDLVRNVSRDVVSFSEREQQVLDLYETLQEFELERSMLEAQKTVRPVSVDDVSELHNQLGTAQEELLKAKAAYSLKRQITENVLMTDPIIKAVHSGTEAAFAER
ncbi:hypothetical protein MMC16_000225, partial [Acarospora aff. strigata]|nr:hypothetical protein [Acarospora aff. strigata]